MSVPESTVSEVVKEVSERMADPSYGQIAIGTFAQSHPDAGRFITAHHDELGGDGMAVMNAVFHAHVIDECLRRHLGRAVPPVGFGNLDEASKGDVVAHFAVREPALASYVASNVETEPMRRLIALVGLAMSVVAA